MNPTQALRWVPATARAAFTKAVGDGFRSWAEGWGLPAPQVLRCDAVPASAPAVPADTSTAMHEAIAAALFGGAAADTPLTQAVVHRAAAAWPEALALAVGAAATPDPGPAGARQPGDRGLVCHVEICGQATSLYVDSASLLRAGWIPAVTAPALPRWAPERVLAALPVRLQATIGTAAVELGDLASLQAGDVIVVSQALAAPIQLRGLHTAVTLPGHLGHMGGRRAVQVVAAKAETRAAR